MQKQLLSTFAIVLLSVTMVRAIAPDPPRSLTAAVNGNTVTLTWLPAATGGVPASYVIEAAFSPGGPTIATLDVVGTGIVVNTVGTATYYVRVRAVNFDGTSSPSNEVVVAVPSTGCSGPPEAPTNLTSSVFGTVVVLNWTPPAIVCPGTGYMLQVGSASGLADFGVISHGPTTVFTATAPAGTYYVRVVAVNALGISAPSNEVMVEVFTGPSNLAGRWSGTSNYVNAPFTFDLTQNVSQIGGR